MTLAWFHRWEGRSFPGLQAVGSWTPGLLAVSLHCVWGDRCHPCLRSVVWQGQLCSPLTLWGPGAGVGCSALQHEGHPTSVSGGQRQ